MAIPIDKKANIITFQFPNYAQIFPFTVQHGIQQFSVVGSMTGVVTMACPLNDSLSERYAAFIRTFGSGPKGPTPTPPMGGGGAIETYETVDAMVA